VRDVGHFENLGVAGRILLKWICEEWDWVRGLEWSGSGYGQVAGCCKCGNELSGYI